MLIEHQSTPDPSMGFRFLFYMLQVWDLQRRQWVADELPVSQWRFAPILPVLFYTGSRTWGDPITITTLMDVPEELTRFVPQHDVLRLNLKATPPQSLVATGQPGST